MNGWVRYSVRLSYQYTLIHTIDNKIKITTTEDSVEGGEKLQFVIMLKSTINRCVS